MASQRQYQRLKAEYKRFWIQKAVLEGNRLPLDGLRFVAAEDLSAVGAEILKHEFAVDIAYFGVQSGD